MSVQKDQNLKLFHFTDYIDIIDISCSSSDSLCSLSEQHLCSSSCLNIKIKEVLHPNFGMYVWPCAPVLGKYMWHNRVKLKDKTVLDLGAGTGLTSIIAAKCGARVVITDSQRYNSVFKITEENLKINDVKPKDFELQELTWGYFTPFLTEIRHIDVILGSDVFYCSKDFEDIIVTVSYLLRKNIEAEFWCAYEQRCSEWNIDYLLAKWNLSCEEILLESFGADKFNVAGCDLPGLKTINLFIFRFSEISA